MTSKNEKETAVIDTSNDSQKSDYSIEVIRKCTRQNAINTSWEKVYNDSSSEKYNDSNKTPPFVSIMITDTSPEKVDKCNNSTQTELTELPLDCSLIDVSLSISKDFNQDLSSNSHSERYLGSKRYRSNSSDTENKFRPWKKTKCTESSTTSCIEPVKSPGHSRSTSQVSSASDTSFKSINSSPSFKVRKRKLKSESNLFKDVLQKSRKSINLTRQNQSLNNSPGGTPRERNHRRSKSKTWRFVDICTWIGKKGYQSITGLYSEILREPINQKDKARSHIEEINELRKYLEEVDSKQLRLARENVALHEQLSKLMIKVEELEGTIRHQEIRPKPVQPQCPPPPPPPPPPLPPPLPPQHISKPLTRSHTIPRCGSAPPTVSGPRLTITPEDIANVKLRKTKDNPVRSKPMPKDSHLPLVTQQMLQATRAKLGRGKPVAASTPKQQLSDLEKCLLQETSVTSLYRRRVARNTFRSAEELRPRPYPVTRCPRSPRSPRSNSLPRSQSPLKYTNISIPK